MSRLFGVLKGNQIFFSIIIVLLICIDSKSQSFPQWGDLKKGRYEVGYYDTLIVKNDENFFYHSYQGKKPFVIGIWYPSREKSNKAKMLFKDYFQFHTTKECPALVDSLKKAYHAVAIESGILIDITPRDSIIDIQLDSIRKKIYEDVLNTPVPSNYDLHKPKNKFPCILYHHGAQSILFDNNVFCEYMASHGYVVVSANYNLPDETRQEFLITGTDKKFNSVSDFKFVVAFAKRQVFIDSANMTVVGHSAGAQVGLFYDNLKDVKSFNKIIALHTTLESRTLEDARKIWPKFNYLFDNEATLCTTPSFIFAPTSLMYRSEINPITKKPSIKKITTVYPEFKPFRNNTASPYTFITVIHPIKHDGFISLGNIRFSVLSKNLLSDGKAIFKQQQSYEKIVRLTEHIIKSSEAQAKKFDTRKYSATFIFESINHK